MLVYRVENADGYGPYLHSGESTDLEYDLGMELLIAHDSEKHPSPVVDFGHSMHYGDMCAFTTLDALVDWFTTPDN